MGEIVISKAAGLPAFLKNVKIESELTANVGAGGFPVMSIKGKVFTLVKDGERETLMNPSDPDEPATSINVVLLKANAGLSKVWYAKNYVEGSDAKPDCFSHNGDVPDPSVENAPASKCSLCPKNQWGSKISDDGRKMKACSDSRRLAIANPDDLEQPMLLRVPAASLKPLAEFGAELEKRGIPYNACVTKIGFDHEAASPKLTFKRVGFVTEADYKKITGAVAGEKVQTILGTSHVDAEEFEATPEAPKVEAKPEPKVEVKEEAKEDVKEEAPKAEKPKAAKPKVVEVSDSLEDELDGLLGDL